MNMAERGINPSPTIGENIRFFGSGIFKGTKAIEDKWTDVPFHIDHELRTWDEFPFQIRDGVSDSNILEVLTDLRKSHNYEKPEDVESFKQLFSCFEPLPKTMMKNTPKVEAATLWDQIGPAFENFKDLSRDEQELTHSVVELTAWSLANAPQERMINGNKQQVSETVQYNAKNILNNTESWLPKLTEEQKLQLSPKAKKNLKVAFSLVMMVGILAGCAGPGNTISPVEHPLPSPDVAPTIQVTPDSIATQTYLLPGAMSTGTAEATLQVTMAPPSEMLGSMPISVPGVELGAGGPDMQINALTTTLKNTINAAGFGIFYGNEGNVSSQTGLTCISPAPEKLAYDDATTGEQLLQTIDESGVAQYLDTQVVLKTVLPGEDYICATAYAGIDNPDFADGTLRQLLIKENADGSYTVIGSRQAAFDITDNIDIRDDGSVWVNGEKQQWIAQEGMQIPTVEHDWNLEIPATPEECINVIRNDTFEHTSEDIASLNKYIMEQRPDGEVFPEMSFYRKKGYILAKTVAFDFFDIESHSADGSTEYNKLLSCSKYGDGIVYGFFLPVGSGENQAIIPVQVFFNTALVEQQAINAGISVSNKEQAVIDNNNQGKNNTLTWRLSGHFADTEEQYKNFSSAIYGRYLDETYDYSNRLELLINHYGEDPQRDQETIELLQKIMLPGLAIPVDS